MSPVVTDKRPPPAYLDSSVLMRYLVSDDLRKAERCRDLLYSAGAGQVDLSLSRMVFAELEWTLRSQYGTRRSSIVEALSDLLEMRRVRVRERELIGGAIASYAQFNVDYVDAYVASEMKQLGIRTIYSYDKDFDRLGVRRLEP